MPRFLQGTTDHDSDGLMGGSNPGDKAMVKKAKSAPRKTTRSDETPEAQPTRAAKKTAAEEQFAKADVAGDVRGKDESEAEELRVGLAARGY